MKKKVNKKNKVKQLYTVQITYSTLGEAQAACSILGFLEAHGVGKMVEWNIGSGKLQTQPLNH